MVGVDISRVLSWETIKQWIGDKLSLDDLNEKNFLGLDDTPVDYENNSKKLIKVKEDETGLTFGEIQEGDIENFKDLNDVPNTYDNSGNYLIKVKSDETGLKFEEKPNIPELEEDTITIDNSGDFISGTVICRKYGDVVHLIFQSDIDFDESSDQQTSGDGLIPEKYRPDYETFDFGFYSISHDCRIRAYTSGKIRLDFDDFDRGSLSLNASITYMVGG